MARCFVLVLIVCLSAIRVGAAEEASEAQDWPVYTLDKAEVFTLETGPFGNFQASALLRTHSGELLTLSDTAPTIYRIEVPNTPGPALIAPITNAFTKAQLAPYAAEKIDRYDCEGLAEDGQGRIYICEEANRWILRWDPKSNSVERLAIDWSPVARHFSTDRNASFEGIAIAGNRMYVANERQMAVIIEVDLQTLKVVDHFVVVPRTFNWLGMHYSDLSWFDGKLYVLCRQNRVILEVNPETHQVLAEFNYHKLEDQLGYLKPIPGVGLMEGLSVDRDDFWMVPDTNGYGRKRNPDDTRPRLLRCPRPQRAPPAESK